MSKLNKLNLKNYIYLVFTFIVIVLDQITKIAIINNFSLYQAKEIFSFFNLVRVHNEGAAFSFLADAGGWQRHFLTLITSLICIFILVLINNTKNKEKFSLLGFAFILGGGIGNLIDRIAYGHVIDFLDFHIKNMHWPSFNLADSFIFIGVCLLFLEMIIVKFKAKNV